MHFLLTLLPKCQSMGQMDSKAKQYPIIRIWNRESFIEGNAGEWMAHALKKPKLPKNLQQRSFLGKMRKGCG